MSAYTRAYRQSIDDPEGFWSRAAQRIDWYSPPERAWDGRRGADATWFHDATMNTAANAVDRHVLAGRGNQDALIYDSPVTGTVRAVTYAELRDEIAILAGALVSLGVGRGDRVLIYMPMVPETVFAMLACARLGAVHSVVFGGFAPHELAVRIDDARPKALLTASCGIEPGRIIPYKPLVDRALELCTRPPQACVVLQRPELEASIGEADLNWKELVAKATPANCVEVAATDPLYILYTSGTTGKPKGVVRDNGGHAVALAWSMENVYDTGAGQVFWAASDVGWVVGHSYIVYAPLLVGATTVLYEGKPVGTPDPGAFWRVIDQHGVRALFAAPTALRAIKKEDPDGRYLAGRALDSLAYLYLAGERTDPDTYHWASGLLGVPIIDHWWQTETGWPIAANCMGLEPLPPKPGSATKPVPGYEVGVLDANGEVLEAGREGAIAIRLPLPPGCLTALWEDDEGYRRSYMRAFDGYYATGDGGYFDEDGYLFVMGRIDDVINVAGHRLSTGSIEAVVAAHDAVAECAVIGAADDLKGQMPEAFVVLKAGAEVEPDAFVEEARKAVREEIGAISSLRRVHLVGRLPKTRSGKVLRKTIRQIVDGEEHQVPSTIDDPSVLEEIKSAVGRRGSG